MRGQRAESGSSRLLNAAAVSCNTQFRLPVDCINFKLCSATFKLHFDSITRTSNFSIASLKRYQSPHPPNPTLNIIVSTSMRSDELFSRALNQKAGKLVLNSRGQPYCVRGNSSNHPIPQGSCPSSNRTPSCGLPFTTSRRVRYTAHIFHVTPSLSVSSVTSVRHAW